MLIRIINNLEKFFLTRKKISFEKIEGVEILRFLKMDFELSMVNVSKSCLK
jgi:hypothetical protein